MTDLDPAPSSIRDESICESSLNPNKSSGDIGERLKARQLLIGPSPEQLLRFMDGIKPLLAESAAEIERLRREVDYFRAGLSALVHCQSPLNRAQMREAARGLLLDRGHEVIWLNGDQSPFVKRALTAESAVAAAMEALKPFAKAFEEPHMEALGLVTITVKKADLKRASAIRAAGGKGD